MIPKFDEDGFLPPGVHEATWDEFCKRFGALGRRSWLLAGLKKALATLKAAGCKRVYIDGSFVTAKLEPQDYDGCWDAQGVDLDKLDKVLLDFSNQRKKQKIKYRGEFFISNTYEGSTSKTFLEFFQMRKDSDAAKGIISIDLGGFS